MDARIRLETNEKTAPFHLVISRYPNQFESIIELPDDYTLAGILLGAGKAGYIETTTLKAFPESQLAKIVKLIY